MSRSSLRFLIRYEINQGDENINVFELLTLLLSSSSLVRISTLQTPRNDENQGKNSYQNAYTLSASSSTNSEDLTFDLLGGLPRPRAGLDLATAEDFLGGMKKRDVQRMLEKDEGLETAGEKGEKHTGFIEKQTDSEWLGQDRYATKSTMFKGRST